MPKTLTTEQLDHLFVQIKNILIQKYVWHQLNHLNEIQAIEKVLSLDNLALRTKMVKIQNLANQQLGLFRYCKIGIINQLSYLHQFYHAILNESIEELAVLQDELKQKKCQLFIASYRPLSYSSYIFCDTLLQDSDMHELAEHIIKYRNIIGNIAEIYGVHKYASVDFSNSCATATGITIFLNSLKASSRYHLDFCFNHFSGSIDILLDALIEYQARGGSISGISLTHSNITDEAVDKIIKFSASHITINLNSNYITDQGAKKLAAALSESFTGSWQTLPGKFLLANNPGEEVYFKEIARLYKEEFINIEKATEWHLGSDHTKLFENFDMVCVPEESQSNDLKKLSLEVLVLLLVKMEKNIMNINKGMLLDEAIKIARKDKLYQAIHGQIMQVFSESYIDKNALVFNNEKNINAYAYPRLIHDFLTQNPHSDTVNLNNISISTAHYFDEFVVVLVYYLLSTNVKKLHLNGNDISDVGAQSIAYSNHFTEVHLAYNNISDYGAKALGFSDSITCLNLSGNKTVADNAAEVFSKNPRLVRLGLSGTNISEIGAKALASKSSLKVTLEDAPGEKLYNEIKNKSRNSMLLQHSTAFSTDSDNATFSSFPFDKSL